MVLYGESPCDPSLDLLDLAEISSPVAEHNIIANLSAGLDVI
jgi:hypothetical protein